MKRRLSIILKFALALVIAFNTLAIGAYAVIGDGNKLSVDLDLEVGTTNTSGVFTPLVPGTALQIGDIITVRICPQTDFYCGATRYVVLFSREYLEVKTAGNNAFMANTVNPFYAAVASGYAGMTGVGTGENAKTGLSVEEYTKVYASNGQAMYDEWASVAVGNQANSNSPNSGYPGILPGDWLFRFNLVVKKDITAGSGARIWMDSNWVRRPGASDLAAYFAKCETAEQLSSSGNSVGYNFEINTAGADINLEPSIIGVTGVSLSQTQASVQTGKNIQLTAAVLPADAANKEVTWSSSNERAATVSSTGLVSAVSEGSAMITVTTVDGGHTANCLVMVYPSFVAIAQNGIELVYPIQVKIPWYKLYRKVPAQQLGFITNIEDFDRVEWSSDNSAKVVVDQNGLITNLKTGARAANITVKLFDSSGHLMASDTIKIFFYKLNYQLNKL